MKRIGAAEAARRLGISRRRVVQLATQDRKAGPGRLLGRLSEDAFGRRAWTFDEAEVQRFRQVVRPAHRPRKA